MSESSEASIDLGAVDAINALFHGRRILRGVSEPLHVYVSAEECGVELVGREVVGDR